MDKRGNHSCGNLKQSRSRRKTAALRRKREKAPRTHICRRNMCSRRSAAAAARIQTGIYAVFSFPALIFFPHPFRQTVAGTISGFTGFHPSKADDFRNTQISFHFSQFFHHKRLLDTEEIFQRLVRAGRVLAVINAEIEKNTAGQHEKHEKERIILVPDKPLEIAKVIRSFDPCMACATHMYNAKGEEIGIISTDPYRR